MNKNHRRKKFDADFWRDHFLLFQETLDENEDGQLCEVKKLHRRSKTKKRTHQKDKSFAEDLNKIACEVEDYNWDRFLKRIRDNRYEESRCRRRLTMSEKNYDLIYELTGKCDCKDPDGFLEMILSEMTDSKIKKFKRTIK